MLRKIKIAVVSATILLSSTAFAAESYQLIAQNYVDSLTKVCVYKSSFSGRVVSLQKRTYEICQQTIFM